MKTRIRAALEQENEDLREEVSRLKQWEAYAQVLEKKYGSLERRIARLKKALKEYNFIPSSEGVR